MAAELWDQNRIGREFGVTRSVVDWRAATIRACRAHVAAVLAAGLPGPAGDVVRTTDPRYWSAGSWQALRKEYGLPALVLPDIALPLPDEVIGNKPLWWDTTLHRWADDTRRRGTDGRLRQAPPPGRPKGIREAHKRAPRAGDLSSAIAGRLASNGARVDR